MKKSEVNDPPGGRGKRHAADVAGGGPGERSAATAYLPGASSLATVADEEGGNHDCWNTIGVAGNGTCGELVRVIHCRNCAVYAAAARQRLDRPLAPDYRREQTAHYSARKQLATPARISVMVFRLGREWFALPTQVFQEVARHRPLHTLPHRQRGIALGLVNVRGELLVCVSLARLLGLEQESPGGGHPVAPQSTFPGHHPGMLLVADWDGHRTAFPVDEVQKIQRFSPDELREAPATVGRSTLTYTRGVFLWHVEDRVADVPGGEPRIIGYLDAERLFTALNRSLM